MTAVTQKFLECERCSEIELRLVGARARPGSSELVLGRDASGEDRPDPFGDDPLVLGVVPVDDVAVEVVDVRDHHEVRVVVRQVQVDADRVAAQLGDLRGEAPQRLGDRLSEG